MRAPDSPSISSHREPPTPYDVAARQALAMVGSLMMPKGDGGVIEVEAIGYSACATGAAETGYENLAPYGKSVAG